MKAKLIKEAFTLKGPDKSSLINGLRHMIYRMPTPNEMEIFIELLNEGMNPLDVNKPLFWWMVGWSIKIDLELIKFKVGEQKRVVVYKFPEGDELKFEQKWGISVSKDEPDIWVNGNYKGREFMFEEPYDMSLFIKQNTNDGKYGFYNS